VADLAHRRVGEHALDVGLDDGDRRGEQCRDRAGDRHRVAGDQGDVVDGVHAADEVDAGGDHGRRVDEGAHGGRAFHGIRQPGVERDLGRLGDRTYEQEERSEFEAATVNYVGRARIWGGRAAAT